MKETLVIDSLISTGSVWSNWAPWAEQGLGGVWDADWRAHHPSTVHFSICSQLPFWESHPAHACLPLPHGHPAAAPLSQWLDGSSWPVLCPGGTAEFPGAGTSTVAVISHKACLALELFGNLLGLPGTHLFVKPRGRPWDDCLMVTFLSLSHGRLCRFK